MTVYLDTTALVGLHVEGPLRTVVESVLDADADWCSSAVTLVEALALVDRLVDEPLGRRDLEDLIRLTWDRVGVIPIDARCLERATTLIRDQPLRLSDALHLAAAERLPRPLSFVTFDPPQIPVALALGFDVVSN
jgi:hypothetical protein